MRSPAFGGALGTLFESACAVATAQTGRSPVVKERVRQMFVDSIPPSHALFVGHAIAEVKAGPGSIIDTAKLAGQSPAGLVPLEESPGSTGQDAG
jgi:hypothetical protein